MQIINRFRGDTAEPQPGDVVLSESHGTYYVGRARIEVRTIASFTNPKDAQLFLAALAAQTGDHTDDR